MFGPVPQNVLFKTKLTSLKTTGSRRFFVVGSIGNHSFRLELNTEVQYKESVFNDFNFRVFNENSELVDNFQINLLKSLHFYQHTQLKTNRDIRFITKRKGKMSEVTIEFALILDNNTMLDISNYKQKVQSKINEISKNSYNKNSSQYPAKYSNTRYPGHPNYSYSGNDRNLINIQKKNNYTEHKAYSQDKNEHTGHVKIDFSMQENVRTTGNDINGLGQTDGYNRKNTTTGSFCACLKYGIMLCCLVLNCCRRPNHLE